MTPGRILKAAVGAAVLISITAGCMPDSGDDPPDCLIAESQVSAVCGWGRDYMNQARQPIVWIRYQRHGETFFRESTRWNVNDIADGNGVARISAYSPTGFAQVIPMSSPA